jgi:exodeoxyribonuclease V gamma subunit
MVRLFYSNRTAELLVELASRVRAQQLHDGPLTPVSIVVPSVGVDSYVRMGIARECGVAANLNVALLTRFASELVRTTSGARLADASSLEGLALRLFLDEAILAQPDLASVNAYVRAGGDRGDAADVRRVQLASRVGRIFEEYTYSRAEMLAAWQTKTTLGAQDADTERWQRRLWLAMFGPDGIARATRPPIVPLHEAVVALEAPPVSTFHVFAFSHVARTFHALFERLAQTSEVHVYSLSPCEGFWEDVDAGDPEPLQLWGRAGREQVRELNRMARFDHDERFADPLSENEATTLRRLQSDVLHRVRPAAPSPPDASIAVLEHASPRRELEAVASAIWTLCEEHPDLRFDEVAVLVPEADAAEYASHLTTVFREAHDLPHQNVGLGAAGASSIVEAAGLLLALPLGRFTRQDLLRVAVHPAIAAAVGEADVERWIAWCDALGIVHGADRGDHEGTYITRDILNWDQGLRRLALGAFMTGDAGGDPRPFELAGEAYAPHEVLASELHDAAAFGLLSQSLLADARFARDAELTLAEWSAFLRTLLSTYLVPAGASDEEQLGECLRRLHAVGSIDVGDRRVGYRFACELARARLATAGGRRGGEGVVVSTIAALRPLPFRVVFACGMGEGRFPAPDTNDPLDLRGAQGKEGDVTARERDRYAFLELVAGTRDRLILSYVSRDPVTGDELAPSSVVHELIHALEKDYWAGPAPRVRHPLRRWDPGYFPDLFGGAGTLGAMHVSEARAEARTLSLRRSAEAAGARVGIDEVQARAAHDPAWATLAAHLGLAHPAGAAPKTETQAVVLLYAIVKFLEFPLQGWARFRLGLDEAEEEDVMAREDEPFETSYLEETTFLRSVLLESSAAGIGAAEAYDHAVEQRELRGSGPTGAFARGERASHLSTLETWREEVTKRGIPLEDIELHRFGRAGELARADQVHDAVAIDVDVEDAHGVMRVVRVDVAGRTQPLGDGSGASITLLKNLPLEKDEWLDAELDRRILRAFVEHAMLSASGVAEGRAHTALLVIADPEEPLVREIEFAPLSKNEATVWLRDVVRDLLRGPHAYFLPCEAVFARCHADPGGPVSTWVARAKTRAGDTDGRPALRSLYGPVPRPTKYPLLDEPTARAIVERRFGLMLQKRRVKS